MSENQLKTKRPSRFAKRIGLAFLIVAATVLAFVAIPQLAATPKADSDRSDTTGGDRNQARTDVTVSRAGSIEPPMSVATYRGEIRARRESSLAIRRSGQLAEVLVNEGEFVEKGQLLAKLDTSDLDVKKQLADADVDVASSLATEAVAGPRYQTVKASAARVRQLQAQMSAAEKRLERQRQLSFRNSGSAQEFDDAKFAAEELKARLDAATAELEELNEGTRVEQIEAAKAKRRAAIAARRQVDIDRADSAIVAPYDGVIANRYFDEGEILTAGRPVLRILETNPIEAHFGVPAKVASDWQIGDSMAVTIGVVNAPAKVVRMQPQVDPVTRTRGIDMQLDVTSLPRELSNSIMVGQTAALEVPLVPADSETSPENAQSTFWIPTEALVRGSRGLWAIYVAVPDGSIGSHQGASNQGASNQGDSHQSGSPHDGVEETAEEVSPNATIERREVRIRRTAGLLSSVEGMLSNGEWVVTDGAHRIGPGVAVRVHVDGQEDSVLPSASPEPTS